MKRRYLRLLAVLAAASMGTVLDISCTTGDPPDQGDHCWFFCNAAEDSKAPHPLYASVPVQQAAVIECA